MKERFTILLQEDWNYIQTMKRPIIWSVLIFFLSVVFGVVFVNAEPEKTREILESIENLAHMIRGSSNYELMVIIFLNNSIKIALSAFFGIILGIIPILFIALNGFLLGMFAYIIPAEATWSTFLLGVVPHGLFEIPALIVGTAIGITLGESFWQSIRKKESAHIKIKLKQSAFFLLRVIIPLLFFAAFVEACVTTTFIG